jgi:hypothetical protein
MGKQQRSYKPAYLGSQPRQERRSSLSKEIDLIDLEISSSQSSDSDGSSSTEAIHVPTPTLSPRSANSPGSISTKPRSTRYNINRNFHARRKGSRIHRDFESDGDDADIDTDTSPSRTPPPRQVFRHSHRLVLREKTPPSGTTTPAFTLSPATPPPVRSGNPVRIGDYINIQPRAANSNAIMTSDSSSEYESSEEDKENQPLPRGPMLSRRFRSSAPSPSPKFNHASIVGDLSSKDQEAENITHAQPSMSRSNVHTREEEGLGSVKNIYGDGTMPLVSGDQQHQEAEPRHNLEAAVPNGNPHQLLGEMPVVFGNAASLLGSGSKDTLNRFQHFTFDPKMKFESQSRLASSARGPTATSSSGGNVFASLKSIEFVGGNSENYLLQTGQQPFPKMLLKGDGKGVTTLLTKGQGKMQKVPGMAQSFKVGGQGAKIGERKVMLDQGAMIATGRKTFNLEKMGVARRKDGPGIAGMMRGAQHTANTEASSIQNRVTQIHTKMRSLASEGLGGDGVWGNEMPFRVPFETLAGMDTVPGSEPTTNHLLHSERLPENKPTPEKPEHEGGNGDPGMDIF